MNNLWAKKRGFTIVELLVTIVVIGILAGIVIVSYNGISQRARDNHRSSDITQLKVAIEKYHADKSKYPAVCSAPEQECSVSALAVELAPYLKSIPHDPRNVADSASDYRYVAGVESDDTYGLKVSYEVQPVCETGVNPPSDAWGALPTCQ